MRRRAKSNAQPVLLALGFLLVLGLALGGFFFFGNSRDSYRTLTSLDTRAYLENSNSLRGNTYKIHATILNALAWSPDTGRLFSVEVDSDILPIILPKSMNHVNVQKGQKFTFKVEVDGTGILKVLDLKKS